MSITLVTNDAVQAGTANELFSNSFVATAGNLIIASLGWANDAGSISVSSLTDTAGNTYQSLTLHRINLGGGVWGPNQQIWYAYNCLGHPTNIIHVVWDATISSGFPRLRSDQFSGLLGASDPFDVEEVTGQANSASLSSGIFSTTTGGLIYSCSYVAGGPNCTAGGGASLINGAFYGDQYRTTSSAQSGIQELQTVDVGDEWNFNVAAFKAATGAALTGTAIGGITEDDLVAGGKTIIITLTGDTFVAN
jgi:hypothetical protein